nr:hypothetical protein CFP56_47711 [Quercus suber]
MDKRRGSREYFQGVNQFVEFASLSARNGKILCPCAKCVNLILQPVNVVRDHCWASGMLNNYKVWKFHGESAGAMTATECGSSQVQEFENLYGDFHGMLHDLCLPHEMPPEPMEEGPTTQHPAEARDVFDTGIGPQHDEDDTYSFSENVPYNISTNEVMSENLGWAWDDIEGMTINASIIAERDRHEVNNLDECEFIDDESDNEDDNEDEYTNDE